MLGVPLNCILVFTLSSSHIMLVLQLQRLASVCFLPIQADRGVYVKSSWTILTWSKAVDWVTHACGGRWLYTVLFILREGRAKPCPYSIQTCLAYKQACVLGLLQYFRTWRYIILCHTGHVALCFGTRCAVYAGSSVISMCSGISGFRDFGLLWNNFKLFYQFKKK